MENNNAYIKSYIRKVLYPTNQFQLSLFPDIEIILFAHISKKVQSSFRAKRIFKGNNLLKIESFLDKHLKLSNLLQKEPEIIVLCFQHFIRAFVAYKTFDHHRIEDLTQDILTKLLTNKKVVLQKYGKNNFNKNKKVMSFFSVLISYIYKEALNDKKYRGLTLDIQKKLNSKSVEMQDSTYLSFTMEEDLKRMKMIFNLYHQHKEKLILSLKCKYKIKLKEKDFAPFSSTATMKEIVNLQLSANKEKSMTKRFETLSNMFNRHAKSNQSGKSLEKWTYRHELEIMNKLNILHNGNVYDLQNTQTLLEYYLVDLGQSNKQIIPMKAN